MNAGHVVKAWGSLLTGYRPNLSIEITRECPLRCPGCYAYEPEHLGQVGSLRSVADYKGQELIDGVLELVRRYRPLHAGLPFRDLYDHPPACLATEMPMADRAG